MINPNQQQQLASSWASSLEDLENDGERMTYNEVHPDHSATALSPRSKTEKVFQRYLTEIELNINKLSKIEKIRVQKWIAKLCEPTRNLPSWQRNRLMYLRFLHDNVCIRQKLGAPFDKLPPNGTLENFPKHLGVTMGLKLPTTSPSGGASVDRTAGSNNSSAAGRNRTSSRLSASAADFNHRNNNFNNSNNSSGDGILFEKVPIAKSRAGSLMLDLALGSTSSERSASINANDDSELLPKQQHHYPATTTTTTATPRSSATESPKTEQQQELNKLQFQREKLEARIQLLHKIEQQEQQQHQLSPTSPPKQQQSVDNIDYLMSMRQRIKKQQQEVAQKSQQFFGRPTQQQQHQMNANREREYVMTIERNLELYKMEFNREREQRMKLQEMLDKAQATIAEQEKTIQELTNKLFRVRTVNAKLEQEVTASGDDEFLAYLEQCGMELNQQLLSHNKR